MADVRDMLKALGNPFSPDAIEQREGGGGRMFDYVATETVIRRLNAAVVVWDFRLTEIRIVETLLVVWGELTIPGLGTRAGTGVQKLVGGEDMWKGAASDCLKKCATLFNVGIDLYGPDLEAGELPQHAPQPRTDGRTTTPQTNGAAQPQARSGLPPTPKQFAFIHSIANELGMDDGQLHEFAGVPSLNDLDRKEVSDLIERLKALQADAPTAEPHPGGTQVVSWTVFWNRARALGYSEKEDLEKWIGELGPNPQHALDRLLAVQRDRQPALA